MTCWVGSVLGNPFGSPWAGVTEPAQGTISRRALHAQVSDARTHLFLFELSALAALPAHWSDVWLTDVDGLGSLHHWGFSEALPSPDPPPADALADP